MFFVRRSVRLVIKQLGGHYVAYTALPPSTSTGSSRPSAESSSSSSTSAEEKSPPPPPENERTATEGKRQWAFISDTNVRLVALEEVLKAKAYLCMYERI